jgi:NADH-quinone oxidoreductase subunit G
MPKVKVDGIEIEVEPGLSVIQACELAGAEIPRFCYHDRLSIAGNCRMCLVELKGAPKLIASCAFPVNDGMEIITGSDKVEKARKGVMEFLLINHPLDCPICDQGGECDLQDQAMAYGFDHSRYYENKRAVPDKYMGPLIKTIMTRCIHCTRCVRFSTEVAGVDEIGALYRGEDMEITTIEQAVNSELSGNLVDICPVGALTSKPYAFAARPWELTKTDSVDVMDAVGSNIRVDARGAEVMRVLPRLHEDINEEWIADKTRYACDGLRRQRLDRPYVRRNGRLEAVSWPEALRAVADRLAGLRGDKMAALAGDLCDAESMMALRDLMKSLGSPHLDCRQDGAAIGGGPRSGYLFNTSIAGIEQADACLLIGTNPRWEAPLINARLRKRYLRGGFKVAGVGPAVNLTYPVEILGDGPGALAAVADGSHPFAEVLAKAEQPMVMVGMGALARPDGAVVLNLARAAIERAGGVRDGWNGFNVLHTAAARVGGLDLGFLPGEGGRDLAGILDGAAAGDIELVYLLGGDEIDMGRLGEAFVVYQGHHGDAGAHRADVVLPGAAYTEKYGLYVNTEGRAQLGHVAAFPPGDAREDWTILRALSEVVGRPLPYDDLGQVRDHLVKASSTFAAIGQVPTAEWGEFGTDGPVDDAPFVLPIDNYYMTDPISRASETMARCTAALLDSADRKATGTDG